MACSKCSRCDATWSLSRWPGQPPAVVCCFVAGPSRVVDTGEVGNADARGAAPICERCTGRMPCARFLAQIGHRRAMDVKKSHTMSKIRLEGPIQMLT